MRQILGRLMLKLSRTPQDEPRRRVAEQRERIAKRKAEREATADGFADAFNLSRGAVRKGRDV